MNIIITFSFLLTLQATHCTWDSSSLTILNTVIHPYSSCLDYCSTFYSTKPQRAYYNTTNANCQPIKRCANLNHVYHYETNQCYSDSTLQKQSPSIIPESLITYEDLSQAPIKCINGVDKMAISGKKLCKCDLLWEDSNQYDMNGVQFRCDQVVTNVRQYFWQKIQFDEKGEVTRYGPYTPTQLQVVLNELKNKERHQTLSYAYNQTEPILYAVNEIVPQERMIREGEEYVAVVMLLIGLVLIGVSYVEMMKIRLVVRKEELKEKVREIMEEGRMIEI